jgi:hypothetical protein
VSSDMVTARGREPAVDEQYHGRVSASEKKTQALITMLVERDCHGIG